MKILYDLPIRTKFAVVLVPLVLIILCFDFLQIQHNYLDYADSDRLNSTIELGVEINHVVHELQKERSISIGYLISDGSEFTEDLANQRVSTDSTLDQYYLELKNVDLDGVFETHEEDLKLLQNYFESLSTIRNRVDKLVLQPSQVREYFSEINDIALNTVDRLINETRDKNMAQQVHALIYFLKAKERASLERAVGMHAFSAGEMDSDLYSDFTTLVAEQKSYIDAFLVIADTRSKEAYNRNISNGTQQEIDGMRAVLHAREDLSINPEFWHEITTDRINALKNVEEHISNRLLDSTAELASATFRKFLIFIFVDILIGALALWLMSIIVSNLLFNVNKLEKFTVDVSKGDLSKKVFIDTKDEIGDYANTFNVMVDEIVKSHAILRKERDKAKFYYNNIYRVSLAVFHNIEQGIFILDRKFKMSKLYSKAMEDIFGVSKIAGENFTNFMRPLIIPRDLEALEMYMRHLFNEDMDEEVVNQLNPIDQVKIYSENEGVVTTKYIRVYFTRIWKKEHISSVMVTVSDETESILLQKHLEEAEKRKKQETEQVLSILKIDPSLIRGFLHNAKKILRSISERYEEAKNSDFRELLNFTFETVHNLKGNAMVIGLDIMSQKFHEVEESIVKMREKDVSGKDFLTILYELDDADKMIDDMSSMLRKVADIYRKYPSGGPEFSNIMLIDTLEKAVKVVSEKLDKKVDFIFKNEQNLTVPDSYVDLIRDASIQLIRNSVKHGIEEVKERALLDKSLTGSISIVLDLPTDDNLEITYQDDGRGLDVARIKERAIESNLITPLDAGKLSEEQIVNLVFEKGFSTADQVDENAGRGQGLGLVKSLIQNAKGKLEIAFEKDKYFKIVMVLPQKAVSKEKIV